MEEVSATNWCASQLPAVPKFLQDLMRKAQEQLKVRRIILFGSRARGDHSPTSDYDLAFDLENQDNWAKYVVEQSDSAATLLGIDFLLLSEASEDYITEIEKSGVVLYEC